MVELRPQPSPAEQVNEDALQERWAQQYLKEEFTRLGFTKVEGPFNRGPDYRVFHKRRWLWAEVETQWKNYFKHGHHENPAFDDVEYLILLSSETPSPDALAYLPPRILHIDRQHFLAWYEKAAAPELLGKEFGARAAIVAGAMQHHWTTICSDVDRDDATCPDCDSCGYFGGGEFGEATPFYQDMAARFLISTGLSDTGRPDLRKVKAASLEQFVEEHPPGE
ncbi:hypothetical protein [Tunturibacter empetritectus]|uniref:Uncharacterized protein n=1 Tax=Tunturiibacter empetritectus TaxID=3069691 RepID=A0A7W8MS55_9BACT|nr:hypothetical protein [Edaphobacter lichenicola]MBB5318012.1 hypothetical protein [Edaphobacter lichenicola]